MAILTAVYHRTACWHGRQESIAQVWNTDSYMAWLACLCGFQWECTPCILLGFFPPCEWIGLFPMLFYGQCWLDNSSAMKFWKLVDREGSCLFLVGWVFCFKFCLICNFFFFNFSCNSLNETWLGFLVGWNELNWFCCEDLMGVFAFGFTFGRIRNSFNVSILQGSYCCRLFTYLHHLILRSSLSVFLQLSVLMSPHLTGRC